MRLESQATSYVLAIYLQAIYLCYLNVIEDSVLSKVYSTATVT